MKWAFWSEWEKVTTDRRMDCQNLSYLQVPILPAPSELFLPKVIVSFNKKNAFLSNFENDRNVILPRKKPRNAQFCFRQISNGN